MQTKTKKVNFITPCVFASVDLNQRMNVMGMFDRLHLSKKEMKKKKKLTVAGKIYIQDKFKESDCKIGLELIDSNDNVIADHTIQAKINDIKNNILRIPLIVKFSDVQFKREGFVKIKITFNGDKVAIVGDFLQVKFIKR